MPYGLLIFTVACVTLGASGVAMADSIRCDGRLVSAGDTAHTLRERCGEPDFTTTYPVVEGRGVRTSATGGAAHTERFAQLVEEEAQFWTYAGDPGKFVRVIQIRKGSVQSVQVLGSIRDPEGNCEENSEFRRGKRAGLVYLACGAPADRSRWVERRARERRDGISVSRTIVRERWTYDPGPGRLLRVLEFENGRLVSLDTRERSPR